MKPWNDNITWNVFFPMKKLRKNKSCWWYSFNSPLKKRVSSTCERSENVSLWFCLIICSMYLRAVFHWSREKSDLKIYTTANQKKIKRPWKEYVSYMCLEFWPMINIFRKLWANNSVIKDCLQHYREWLSPVTFHQLHSNSNEVSYRLLS